MKKILIDLQSCQSGSRKGGIGRYSIELVKKIIELYSCNYDFYILLNGTISSENEVRNHLGILLPQSHFITLSFPQGIHESKTIIQNEEYKTQLAEGLVDLFLCDFKPDYFLITSFVEGLDENVVTAINGVYPKEKIGVILYDLIPLVMADKYLTNHVLEKHYLRKIDQIKKAGKLFAISEYSKLQAVHFEGFVASKIKNISSAVTDDFKKRKLSEKRISEIKNKYQINGDFILFAGSFDSRKNHERLIEAYALLSSHLKSKFQLVIVGNGWVDKYNQLLQHARGNGVSDGRVIFCGHVGDEDLIDIYNIAHLFIFPSLSEGFGLPVLEAMSCGTPVIGSNTTSIVEAVGLENALFDPLDVKSISKKINQALTDEKFYRSLKEHALIHSRNFSWNKSTEKLMHDVINECLNLDLNLDFLHEKSFNNFLQNLKKFKVSNNITKDYLIELTNSIRFNEITSEVARGPSPKLRYAWVTTWNTRCGIASYSKSLMECVDGHHRIYAPFSNELLESDQPNVKRCWEVGSDSLESLIEHLASSDADVVVIQMNHGFFDFPKLANIITILKNLQIGLMITLHSTVDPPKDILDRSLATISDCLSTVDVLFVHTLEDVKNLEKTELIGNVKIIPHGYKPYLRVNAEKAPKTNYLSIATFGFMLKHKGIIELIEAFSILKSNVDLKVKIKLKLLNSIYSESASGALIHDAKMLIKKLDLQGDVVMINDYLQHEDIFEQLASSNLIVFPYQNTSESSSAAVRSALPIGVPIAVTPISIFNDIKECSYVFPGTSPLDMALGMFNAIESILLNDSLSQKLKIATKNWCYTNSFEQVGKYFSQNASVLTSFNYERPSHESDC